MPVASEMTMRGKTERVSRRGRRALVAAVLAAVLLCGIAPPTTRAEPVPATEYAVKAAYLVNFLLFAERQDAGAVTGRADRVIGIVGADPFGSNFSAVEDRPVGSDGRKLRIVRLARFDEGNAGVLRLCDLVFIATSEKHRIAEIIKATRGAPALTVSEVDGFTDAGGMIRLVLVGNTVRWEINKAAVKSGGINLSAQLYRNATRVSGVSQD